MAFLHWLRAIFFGAVNGILKFALAILLIFLLLVVIGLTRGDGLPGNMVLSLDLRAPIKDSQSAGPLSFGATPTTVMDIVLALDHAGRDSRVKGVFMRVGSADMPVAQAEEIGAALKRFRATGKFAIADAPGLPFQRIGRLSRRRLDRRNLDAAKLARSARRARAPVRCSCAGCSTRSTPCRRS